MMASERSRDVLMKTTVAAVLAAAVLVAAAGPAAQEKLNAPF